jgi:hypothetical protein
MGVSRALFTVRPLLPIICPSNSQFLQFAPARLNSGDRRAFSHFLAANRPATPRYHRHPQNPENPRKPNPHNHFPPSRTPQPAARSPFPTFPSLKSTRTHNQAHSICPHASHPVSFRPCGFYSDGPERHVLRSPGQTSLAKRDHGARAPFGECDFQHHPPYRTPP